VRYHAEFCADPSNPSGDMVIFQFFQDGDLPPSWICVRLFGPHTTSNWSFYCANFGWNRCSGFDNMQVLIFCALSLKIPIHAPKIGFLGVWPTKWGAVWIRPQKALPCVETRRMTYRSSKLVHWCGLGASQSM